jgi:hypothetical protein
MAVFSGVTLMKDSCDGRDIFTVYACRCCAFVPQYESLLYDVGFES